MSAQITLMTVCLMLSGCVGASELKHAPLNADNNANVLLFGGNILLQPAYYNLDLGDPNNYPVANNVVENTFWLGVYPGLTKEMLDFVIEKTKQFLESNTN